MKPKSGNDLRAGLKRRLRADICFRAVIMSQRTDQAVLAFSGAGILFLAIEYNCLFPQLDQSIP